MKRISQLTRTDIFDNLRLEKIDWSGRLEEPEFLSRIYDLGSLPSYDGRFKDAAGDIWQHRVGNYDWDDDWVCSDQRFGLMSGDDDILLRFLCETIHPVVRNDRPEVNRLLQMYNEHLKYDGYAIVERGKISGKPIYAARRQSDLGKVTTDPLKKTFSGNVDSNYVAQQITRMETSIDNDPGLAIGTSKELVETCCKTILDERKVTYAKDASISQLVKLTTKELKLAPDSIPNEAKAIETIRSILGNLAAITKRVVRIKKFLWNRSWQKCHN